MVTAEEACILHRMRGQESELFEMHAKVGWRRLIIGRVSHPARQRQILIGAAYGSGAIASTVASHSKPKNTISKLMINILIGAHRCLVFARNTRRSAGVLASGRLVRLVGLLCQQQDGVERGKEDTVRDVVAHWPKMARLTQISAQSRW